MKQVRPVVADQAGIAMFTLYLMIRIATEGDVLSPQMQTGLILALGALAITVLTILEVRDDRRRRVEHEASRQQDGQS